MRQRLIWVFFACLCNSSWMPFDQGPFKGCYSITSAKRTFLVRQEVWTKRNIKTSFPNRCSGIFLVESSEAKVVLPLLTPFLQAKLTQRGLLGLIFAGYVPLASKSLYPILVYSVTNCRPHLSHFWANMWFSRSQLSHFLFLWIDHFLDRMKGLRTLYFSSAV